MTKSKTNVRYSVLDLFSGAGGLTEGFLRRNYDFISHIEVNPYASDTLKTRILYHQLVRENRKDIYYQYYNGETKKEEFLQV